MTPAFESLVLCFDGTWNSVQSHTNVSRLYSQIADAATGCPFQHKFYDEGVGTKRFERLRGGMFGAGLDENIRQGYAWLTSVFRSDISNALDTEGFCVGSSIFIFGFSRGAFTARSLGGLINYLGIPRIEPTDMDPNQESLADHPLIREAWDLYSARATSEECRSNEPVVQARIAAHKEAVAAFRERKSRWPCRIHLLGVWDTVGALGIPRVFDQVWIPRFSSKFQFHDTALGRCVRFAYHAVAIDENRLPYTATLWTAKEKTTEEVEQRWFSGAHANVGGGYADDLLPAPPLQWLAAQAAKRGLYFVNDRREMGEDRSIPAAITKAPAAFELDGTEYLSPVRDSYKEFLRGGYSLVRSLPGMGGRVYRRMLVSGDGINQTVDATAFQKWKVDPEYRPPNLGQAGRADVSFNVARDIQLAMDALREAPSSSPNSA